MCVFTHTHTHTPRTRIYTVLFCGQCTVKWHGFFYSSSSSFCRVLFLFEDVNKNNPRLLQIMAVIIQIKAKFGYNSAQFLVLLAWLLLDPIKESRRMQLNWRKPATVTLTTFNFHSDHLTANIWENMKNCKKKLN